MVLSPEDNYTSEPVEISDSYIGDPIDEGMEGDKPVAEEQPAAEQPIVEQPAEEVPSEEAPAEEAPAEEAPAEEEPAEPLPLKNHPKNDSALPSGVFGFARVLRRFACGECRKIRETELGSGGGGQYHVSIVSQ